MKTATIRLKTDERGSDVPKAGVTPAEAVLLALDHMKNVGSYPIHAVVEDEDPAVDTFTDSEGHKTYAPRTVLMEMKRLRSLYTKKRVDALFPGAKPSLPEDFAEAEEIVTQQAPKDEDAKPGTLFGSEDEAVAAANRAAEALERDN